MYNLLFMLIAFLASEGVKSYQASFSNVLYVLGALQVARIFILPMQAHNAVVTVGGVEQSREIFNTSKYRATNVTYAVGTRSDSPEAVSAISAAISTNSLDKVRAAAAQWNAAAVEQKKAEAEAEAAQAAEQEQQNTQPAAETPVEQPTPTPEPVPVTETPQDDPGQPVAETPAQ